MKRGNTAENAIFCSFIWCANLANGLVQKSKKKAAIYKGLKSQLSFSEDMCVTTLLVKYQYSRVLSLAHLSPEILDMNKTTHPVNEV